MWNYMNFGSPSDTFLPRIPQIQRLAEENFQKVFMEAQEAITDRSRDSWNDLQYFDWWLWTVGFFAFQELIVVFVCI